MVTCFSFLEPVCELPLSENVACWCSISFLIYIYNLSLSNNCTVETEFGHMFNFWRLERVIASPGLGQLSLRKCTLGHIDIAVGIIRNIGIWHRRWYLEMARNTGIVFPVFRVVRKLFHILAWQMPGSLLQTENPGQSFDRYLNYVFVIWSKVHFTSCALQDLELGLRNLVKGLWRNGHQIMHGLKDDDLLKHLPIRLSSEDSSLYIVVASGCTSMVWESHT